MKINDPPLLSKKKKSCGEALQYAMIYVQHATDYLVKFVASPRWIVQ